MGRMACTEPQCLYKGDLYLYLFFLPLQDQQLAKPITHIWYARLTVLKNYTHLLLEGLHYEIEHDIHVH